MNYSHAYSALVSEYLSWLVGQQRMERYKQVKSGIILVSMLIDGKKIAKDLEKHLLEKLQMLPTRKVRFLMFGDNASSRQFMSIKSRVAERLGISSEIHIFAHGTTTKEACELIDMLAGDDVHGVVVQLPLPHHIDTDQVIRQIPYDKDIDVLDLTLSQRILEEKSRMIPPVARAVMRVLEHAGIELVSKKILIIGRGRLVGRAVAEYFDQRGIEYEVVDITTPLGERDQKILSADIIIGGAGVPHMITHDMVKEGVILIDAGTSEQEGTLVGDIHPECIKKASLLTPIPGGIGPITVISLFENLLHTK